MNHLLSIKGHFIIPLAKLYGKRPMEAILPYASEFKSTVSVFVFAVKRSLAMEQKQEPEFKVEDLFPSVKSKWEEFFRVNNLNQEDYLMYLTHPLNLENLYERC